MAPRAFLAQNDTILDSPAFSSKNTGVMTGRPKALTSTAPKYSVEAQLTKAFAPISAASFFSARAGFAPHQP
jgi:hypothetical protein